MDPLASVLGLLLLVAAGLLALRSIGPQLLRGPRQGRPLSSAATSAPRRCPRCSVPLLGPDCIVCHWPAPPGVRTPDAYQAINALTAQIEQLERLGALAPGASRQLLESLAAERTRLIDYARQQRAAEQPAAAEVVTAPVVQEPLVATPVEAAPIVPESVGDASPREPNPAPLAPTIQTVPAARPVPPRRSWSDWLAGFMEERNIRWGELVGGLLIVCCSVALVISFWSEIESRPWLKFLLFNGVTAGIFGVGFLCEYRWRLRTTSRGLLTIGSLLVPLNFLAIAALSSAPGSDGLVTIAGELVSAGLFAGLVYFAARVLVGVDEVVLTAGLLIIALSQLLVRRFVTPATDVVTLVSIAAIPAATYLAGNLWHLRRVAAEPMPDEERINGLLRFLGLTSFAVILPIALLLYRAGQPIETLRQMPALAGLLGFVPLCAGLLLWQKLAGRSLTGLRTAGTAVAVMGAVVTLAGLVIGWPQPSALLPAAVLEFAIFTFVAWRFRLPAAHLAAAPCLALAYLLMALWWGDHLTWAGMSSDALRAALVSGESGVLLSPLVLLYLGAAGLAWRRELPASRPLALAAVGLMAISVALMFWFGFGDAGVVLGVDWIYLLYAACWFVVAARVRYRSPAWIGSVLLLMSIVGMGTFRFGPLWELPFALLSSLLAYATLMAAIGFVSRLRGVAIESSSLASVAWRVSLTFSVLTAVRLVMISSISTVEWQAMHWSWLAALWGAAAIALNKEPLAALFQAGLSWAVVLLAVVPLSKQSWFAQASYPWLEPWTLQTIGAALAALNLVWVGVRLASRRDELAPAGDSWTAVARKLVHSPWMSVDRVLTVGLIGLVAGLAIFASLSGALVEISPISNPTAFELKGAKLALAHEHAAQWGSWLLLGALLVLLVGLLRERASSGWMYAAFVVAACACPLVAARFEDQRAVASGLVWSSVGFLLLASTAIWWRQPVAHLAARLGWPTLAGDPRAKQEAALLVLVLGLLAPVGLPALVAGQAIVRTPQLNLLAGDGLVYLIVGLVLATLGVIIWLGRRTTEEGVGTTGPWPDLPFHGGAITLLLGILPLIGLLLYHAAVALVSSPIQGFGPQSIFAALGWPLAYTGPGFVASLVLVGFALRDRDGLFAVIGNATLCTATVVAYLLVNHAVVTGPGTWIRVAQITAIVSAAYTLGWSGLAAWDARLEGRYGVTVRGESFGLQAVVAPVVLSLPLLWTWAHLFRYPVAMTTVPLEVADVLGLLALVAASLSAWVAASATNRPLSQLAISALLVGLTITAAGVAARWDTGNWLAYHTLYVGHGLTACLLTGMAWRSRRSAMPERELLEAIDAPRGAIWPFIQTTALLALAFRQIDEHLWWAVGGIAFAALVQLPAISWLFQRRRYLYIAVPLANLAGITTVGELNWIPNLPEFLYWNVTFLAVLVPYWLAIELSSIRRRAFRPRFAFAPVHRVVTPLAIALLTLTVGFAIAGDATGATGDGPLFWLNWIALAATLLAVVACLYDEHAGEAVPLLYSLGIVACGILLDGFNLSPPWLLWTGNMVLAAYALATSYLWSRRAGLREIAAALRIPRAESGEFAGLRWLVPCNAALITTIVTMTFVVQLTNERIDLRNMAAVATLTQVVSLGLLARGDRRGVLQLAALSLGALGAVFFGWSWLLPGSTFTVLHALVVVAAATAGVAAFYGLALSKLLSEGNEWLSAAQSLMPPLALASATSLAVTLGIEVLQFATREEVLIDPPAIVVVAVTLAALALALLAAAVLPGRDPLGLSEKGRMAYVYAAEIIAALLFVHIRVTCAWMFSGFYQQFWPLIAMAIAFLGVGVAEVFHRRQQYVLSKPLENTGILLPVLPVIGYWVADSEVDYSLLLLVVGVLYGGLSIARRSFGFGVLAAVAANGGLWYLLSRQDGWGFLAHPQVWLIPPALCVLAAAYLNRRQLSEAQMTAIRYFTSMAIYISSTADIFLNGVAQNPWLPMILAGLSVLGILAGILLRVRAFLFLGTGFLTLALFTVIWYAAVDLHQTWIWAASGIVLGILLVVMFGFFEMKRQRVLEVVDRLKQWEA